MKKKASTKQAGKAPRVGKAGVFPIWWVVFLLLLAVLLLEIAWLWMTASGETERASAHQQRLVYDIKTGQFQSHGAPEATEAKASDVPQDDGHDATKEAAPSTTTPSTTTAVSHAPEVAKAPAAVEPTFANPSNKPVIAVMLVGVGLSQSSTEQALSSLSPQVGLSLSPYAPTLREWAEQAKAKGFEVWVDVPMEPDDFPMTDPGPRALLTSHDAATIKQRMEWLLGRTPLAKGFVTPISEKFMDHRESVERLYQLLGVAKVRMTRSEPVATDSMRAASETTGFTPKMADLVLDNAISREAIDAQLQSLLEIARKEGSALAVGRPYPLTVRRLQEFLPMADKLGVMVVPVSLLPPKHAAQPAAEPVATPVAAATPAAGAGHAGH